MKKLILFHIIFLSLQSFSAVYLKVVYIADHKAECGDKTCLLIRDTPTDDYQIFDKEISGFTYQEGYEYCILLEIQTPGISVPAIPFDSTQIKYVLSEVKSKVKTGQPTDMKKSSGSIPDSSKWLLYKLRLKDGSTKTFSIQKAYIQFDVNTGTLGGNTECNSFHAGFTTDSSSFTVDNIVTTKMACGKHSIEPAFLNMLNTVTRYKITDKLLYLYKGKTLLALFTRKK